MNIGVIQLGRIGDMILMTPLFSEIKKMFPESLLHVYAGPSNYSIILNNPNIDLVKKIEKSPFGLIKTLFNLKFLKYNIWIDPKDHFSNESRIIASIVNSNLKIGFNPDNKKQVFDKSIFIPKNSVHHVEISLNALIPLGYEKPNVLPKPELFTDANSDNYVSEFLNNVVGKYAVLNISGSAEHKMWNNKNWIKFLEEINLDLPIILCFAPNEKPRAYDLAKSFPNLNIFNSRNINDMVSLIAGCEFLITPDTAVVHIAAAFNKPVFGLYSGLDEFYAKFHPLSDNHCAVRAEKGDKGIKSIKPETAIKEFLKFYYTI
jgi:ADP-heptose:LPS heptosyltransferase